GRKPRPDAQRDRQRILQVAKEAFIRSGANASLDDIAKQADVGPGTVYRHFPTRDALLEAIYRTEVEKLGAAERKFAEAMPRLKRCEPGCCCSLITSRPKRERINRDVHPDDLERVQNERSAGLSRGMPFETEKRLLGKDGQFRWFSFATTRYSMKASLVVCP